MEVLLRAYMTAAIGAVVLVCGGAAVVGSDRHAAVDTRPPAKEQIEFHDLGFEEQQLIRAARAQAQGAGRALLSLSRPVRYQPVTSIDNCAAIYRSCAITSKGTSGVVDADIYLHPMHLADISPRRELLILHETAHVIWYRLPAEVRADQTARLLTAPGRWLCAFQVNDRHACASPTEQWADEYARLSLRQPANNFSGYQTPPLLGEEDLAAAAAAISPESVVSDR